MVSKSIKVNILGREFFLKSEANEEYINQVAEFVREKIETIQKAQALDIIPTVILAALNIADDYFQLRSERESLLNKVENRSVHLLNIINSQIK